MFESVIKAKHIKDYKVWIAFDDGKSGEIDLAEKISWGEIFEPLKDINYFKNFRIENDTLSWENGADLAPESLYELLIQQTNKK
jgi:sugar phosphate isomerase/epimerase